MNAPSTKKKSAAAQMRIQALKALSELSVMFSEHNGGAHLIVQGLNGFIDYWPGAGRWICRVSKKEGFGCENLIRYIKGY
jgi:hypothetical protein